MLGKSSRCTCYTSQGRGGTTLCKDNIYIYIYIYIWYIHSSKPLTILFDVEQVHLRATTEGRWGIRWTRRARAKHNTGGVQRVSTGGVPARRTTGGSVWMLVLYMIHAHIHILYIHVYVYIYLYVCIYIYYTHTHTHIYIYIYIYIYTCVHIYLYTYKPI